MNKLSKPLSLRTRIGIGFLVVGFAAMIIGAIYAWVLN